MTNTKTAILHYSAPPIVGGVESVIQAHAQVFLQAGYPVTVIAGRGEQASLPAGTGFVTLGVGVEAFGGVGLGVDGD